MVRLHQDRSRPVLGGQRRRKLSWNHSTVLLALLAAAVAYMGVRVIGRDLGAATHIGVGHVEEAKVGAVPANALAAAVGSGPAVPGPAPVATPGEPASKSRPRNEAKVETVAQQLLATARDHLGRKVTPTTYSVDDPRANSGSHLDLLERALAGNLSLKSALVRHRTRNPQAYGLASKPAPTLDERRRTWTTDNLLVFLGTFAEKVAVEPASSFEAGDIVVVQRKRGSQRQLAAVVSDVADEAGNPQILVLDPADHAPRELPIRGNYNLLHHFRLTAAHLEHIRQALDLGAGRGPIGTTL
ncbi:MAG: DUF1287 domain-containing protein [Deltaproteobacteria bacterium]|nr:DUF1287 domain-containing protein [Deltaproteobacteria bacterium]